MASNSFFKQSLAVAIAMASVTTAAASAFAVNKANFGTSNWSGKSTSLGSFGAGYGASFTTDVTDGALSAKASGDASIQLFGTKVSIVDLSATASINDSSADGANLSAEIVGVTVYEKSFSDGFTFDASEDLNNYEDTFCTEFFDVSTTFTLVVVPVTMSAGAEGCANLTFSATPQYNTSTHEGILNLDVEPALDVSLTVSAGVGTSAFSAGVEAEVTLLDLAVPITLDPVYNFTTNAFSYNSTGQLGVSMLDGSLNVYAKADLGLWDVKYSKEIFDWNGISKSWYLWSTGKPTATSPAVTIEGGSAEGSYVYADTADTDEGTSLYKWYRSSSDTATTGTLISDSTGRTHIVVDADNGNYLRFCVTPRNANVSPTSGDEQCSDWEYVGKVASFYQHDSYDGTNLSIAYEKTESGTCFNLEDYISWFDNDTSSYKLHAPADSSATFHFYKAFNCSDTSSSEYENRTVSAGGSSLQTSTSNLGSSWNDRLSSVMVVFNEKVTAENVGISISGNKASSTYTLNVGNSTHTTESGSSYVWYRASDSSGSGSAVISGSSSVHTLGYSDDQKYLKVCVTPSNGYTTGSQVCSGWTAVGHLLKFFEDANHSGDHIAIAWEKSENETCFNMTDYSFNDTISSYNWYNNSVSNSTLWLYKDINCTGSSATRTVSAGGSEAISSVGGTFGDSWQDKISSFRVSWSSSVNITTPSLSIYGNAATESHSYSDSSGRPESAQYTWYRASDASGTSTVTIANATSSAYKLTESDNKKYLKVCVLSSNGVMVDEYEHCSDWTSVGSLMQLFADSSQSGTSVHIAYEKSPSGSCLNLTDIFVNDETSFNDTTTSVRAYAPTSKSATFSTYKHTGCSTLYTTTPVSANASSAFTFVTGSHEVSSIKVVY